MPYQPLRTRPAMYNTPQIRTGGFGALQVEAVTNRPLSIARRHLAASQLRMRDIEPDELSSSEWVRFLVMEERERERWMGDFVRRRRGSNESSSSAEAEVEDRETAYDKAEEAREEAEQALREEVRAASAMAVATAAAAAPVGATPRVSLWARQFDDPAAEAGSSSGSPYTARRPRHTRHAVSVGGIEAPPTYESAVRSRTPPPAYEPRSDDEGDDASPAASPRDVRGIDFALQRV